ncbi:peptidoglycan editing factor PgeF [Aeromonas taiwanensis]|uniref:Purine nucleoside phosphorylase n=1 Tax=Aeromonas taiwanensis TaxID=633417 RepID=A0A5F0KGX9_9GAMM|nr:peptidoglycan editing factor PgeF [Aeromonas taiwanensis]TFF81330.1 peptidoglycan editing factor PgeF [Aeromonas taiwanensis]TFF82274.1 peptidoglycan editing factor PgeF [Aeromonas taiwanensis]TFF83585.1 peptidoglycan editing factor PgeF [Aeromonas taiwanensis]
MNWIQPDWPAPGNVRALSTTRDGGVSEGVFAGLNLGAHVGDEPARVEANRARLQQEAAIPGPLNWLNQVHGIAVHPVSDRYERAPDADAACAHEAGLACIVMTADCLPVLFCDRAGTRVAAAHAGWRGLHAGVLEESIDAMGCEPAEILVWLGPAIGPTAFEVGGEVRDAFVAEQAEAVVAFVPSPNEGKWLADIYQLARLRLARAGVTAIYGGKCCTFSDSEQFYSYRRDGQTGRMASIIWLEE